MFLQLDNEQVAELEHEPEPELEPEPEPILDVAVEEEEEEEDWDAKSWEQEVNLPAIKSAFAEEEVDDGPVKAGQVITPHVSVASTQPKPTSPKKKAAPPVKGPRHKVVESEDEDDEDNDEEAGESEEDEAHSKRQRDAREKREARRVHALTKRSADDLRSPICCILGHVDTGKTKLLDCIRRTNVQEGEAGGITQQIGATYFPMENIRERTKELKSDAKLRVPGLLVIDTPGHESFTNLRARGSSLCDIAILVIDIMHGLEPQTIESLNLLKARQTPFVVALNKVDRMYGWKTCPNAPIRNALKVQTKDVNSEFEMRTNQIITELKEQGLNSELYYKNKEVRKFISIVPTSAISGEGIPDLLLLLVQLTQKMMEDKLMFISEVQCTVLEVKVVEGLGTTIDVVLVNGVLHEGDQIVVCGMQGPIVTSIRALLTPHPMKELRVKGSYQHHKELKAAQGIKLTAQGLEHAIAGTQLYVVGPDDDLEDVKEEAMQDMKNVMSRVDKSGEGVCVQASTLGSLEALLEFLKSPAVKIPVSGISIGPVHKRDVMRASVMLERKRKEFATILAFDVKVTPEAKQLADETGVRIFTADIIYHLFDQFTAYINSVKEEKRKDASEEAVFPCVLRIMPQCVFNKKDPIVVGVDVIEGVAKVGTPLCVPSRDGIDIGKIVSMEVNHKVVDTAKKGQSVAMKIVGTNADEMQKMFGRHFDMEDELVSRITRQSIDLLKENYRDDLSTEEWKLVVKLKKLFEIT
jgi:translation initiation factor 5B